MVNKRAIKLWVDALRSGRFVQGRWSLHETSAEGDKFCCLGVACLLAIEDGVPVTRKIRRLDRQRFDVSEYPSEKWAERNPNDSNWSLVFYNGESIFLPDAVRKWLGLYSENPHVGKKNSAELLSGLNDDGVSFNEIADAIEKEWLNA